MFYCNEVRPTWTSTATPSLAVDGVGGAPADQPLTGAEAREPTLMPGMVKRETPLRMTAQTSVSEDSIHFQFAVARIGNVSEDQAVV